MLAASGGFLWLLIHGSSALSLSGDACILLGATAVQAGFDWLGGAVLMPVSRPTMRRFLQGWLPGALGHLLILVGVGLLSYASFRVGGGFTPAVLLATVGLAWGRRGVLRAVAGVRVARASDEGKTVLAAQTDDPAFTGEIVGWGTRRGQPAARLLAAKSARPRNSPPNAVAAAGRSPTGCRERPCYWSWAGTCRVRRSDRGPSGLPDTPPPRRCCSTLAG